jgi:hypothetical protein
MRANVCTRLRERCDRIHWAGTETSAVVYGLIDSAVRAATEVMPREKAAVAWSAERRPLRPVHLGLPWAHACRRSPAVLTATSNARRSRAFEQLLERNIEVASSSTHTG